MTLISSLSIINKKPKTYFSITKVLLFWKLEFTSKKCKILKKIGLVGTFESEETSTIHILQNIFLPKSTVQTGQSFFIQLIILLRLKYVHNRFWKSSKRTFKINDDKGVFFQKVWCVFQISKPNIYSKLLSWAWKLN